MPLTRKSQVAALIEVIPGVEQTVPAPAGADVVEVLETEFTQSRSMIERQPADPSLSGVVEGIGRGDAGMRFACDLRGSGTATTAPDWTKLVLACYHRTLDVKNLVLNSGSTEAVFPGDKLSGATATARVAKYAAAGSTTIKVCQVTGTFTAGAPGESIVSQQQGTIGTCLTAPGAATGIEWAPYSERTMSGKMTAGGWDTDPAVGEGIVFKNTVGQVIGGGWVVIADAAEICTFELGWGTVILSGTLTSSTGKVATFHASPVFTNVAGPSLTMLMNRDKFRRGLIGARGNFRFEVEAGGIGRMSFEYKGRIRMPDDTAFLSGAALSTVVPPRLQGGYFSIDGAQVPVKSIAFDAGVTTIMRADGNSTEGDWAAEITGRDPTFTFTIDQVPLAQLDLHTKWRDGTLINIGLGMGTTAGNSMAFFAVSAQITEISDGDAEGIPTFQVTTKLRRVAAAGDDEYHLIQS